MDMEARIRKELGSGIEAVEVLPAFAGGGDLQIARVRFGKDGAPVDAAPEWAESWTVRRTDAGLVGALHFYALRAEQKRAPVAPLASVDERKGVKEH
jgi:hypothetical protein